MVSELDLAGGPGFEPSPCKFELRLLIRKSIMDSDSPHAQVCEGGSEAVIFNLKFKSYKIELLKKMVI